MKIFSEENIGKLIILNSSLVGLLMWLGIVAHTCWDSKVNLAMELDRMKKAKIDAKKTSVSESVNELIQSIEVRRQMSKNRLRHNLKNQVLQVHAMMTHLYEKNKERMKRAELEQLVIEAVRPFKFSNRQSWFFIRSLQGVNKLWPPDLALEGRSIYDYSNENKIHVFHDMSKIARSGGGYYEYFWPKPGAETEQLHQAAAYIAYFAPFDWYVGTAEYLDELERDTQLQFQATISRHAGRTEDEYIQIIDLNGISTAAAASPLSRLLRGGSQDPGAKQIREELLAGLKNGGQIFVKYQDKDANTDQLVDKMTYFRLYDRWNWLIASGFDYSDLEEMIQFKKKEHQRLSQEKLRISLAIFCFILLGALCISLLFAHRVRTLFLSYRQRLEDSNKNLRKAKDAACAATHAKSEFLARMSHEIRTPMHGIIGLTELLLESRLSWQQEDYLRKILFSSRSLEEVINDILDFSRIEAGMLTIEQVRFNLAELFDKLMLIFNESSRRKNLRLTLSLPPDLPEQIIGDPMRLHQVLSNLIANAVKFTEKGEITVKAAVAGQTENRVQITFTVSDTGIGIPEDKIVRLFEAFTQADSSTARKYGGTGLGLTICKRLVYLMGGELTVHSEVNCGSVFSFSLTFLLPSQQDADADAGRADEVAEAMQRIRKARILLAEDNSINREVALAILAKAELQVEAVGNGAEAVAAVEEREFDAVLMDIQMPVMDGYEATRKIRQELGRTELPIIAMTAHAVCEERDKCFRMGMDDHIAKPVNRRALFYTLGRWIRNEHSCPPPAACNRYPACFSELFSLGQDSGTAPDSLDLPAALRRLDNNKTLYLKLLRSFCHDQQDAGTRFEELIQANNIEAAMYEAHSLKGVAGNIGLRGIQQQAAETEKKLRAGWTSNSKEALRRLARMILDLVEYCTPRLQAAAQFEQEQEPSAIPEHFDKHRALEAMRQLALLLEQSDFSSLQFLEEHQEIIRPLLRSQDFVRLLHCIEGFVFEEALAVVKGRLHEEEDCAAVSKAAS